MNKTYNLYCDESTHLPHDGNPYMILGYVSVAYPQVREAKRHIREIMKRHGFEGELKWTNVHEATLLMYQELIDYFFMTGICFRALVVDKRQIDLHRDDYSYEDFYFKMYFQLLHHGFDLNCRYNLYLDIKDTCSHHKLRKLHTILAHNTAIHRCQFLRSHEAVLMQLADVLMGALNYHLRMKSGTIGGAVVAKRKIVDKIQRWISTPLEQGTSLAEQKFNRFFIRLQK